jgi:protein-disulfide isomerase
MKIHLSVEGIMHREGVKQMGRVPSSFFTFASRGLLFGAVSLSIAACSKDGPDTAQAAPSAVGTEASIPDVLATIGNDKITIGDIRTRTGDKLDQLEAQYLKARSKTIEDALQEILRERVIVAEANKTGKTIEDLVLAEAGGTYDPTDVEIEAWFNENKSRLGNRTVDEVRAQIADLLRKKRRDDAAEKLQNRLNEQNKVAINFQPFRLAFNNTNAPTMGKEGAKVQLVEFSDFQCPFCRQFAPTLHQVAKNYGDKVQIVYRQYPIPSLHPSAFKAAEASLCANDQGKFWALHDMMFLEQDRLAVSDLKEKAVRLGMDKTKFSQCLDTGKYTEQVQRDTQEAIRSGANGTPAVYVNGVEVPGGAVPYSSVAAAIERELARVPKTN